MSGTDHNNFRAPTRLTPPTGDSQIALPDGRATMWFLQFLQRLMSYIGQPTGNNVPGQTISSQLSAVQAEAALATFRPSVDGATLQRIAALERQIASLRGSLLPVPLPSAPRLPLVGAAALQDVQRLRGAVASLQGRPPRPSGLNQAQVLSRIWFYGT